jgi:hypothetical protein
VPRQSIYPTIPGHYGYVNVVSPTPHPEYGEMYYVQFTGKIDGDPDPVFIKDWGLFGWPCWEFELEAVD